MTRRQPLILVAALTLMAALAGCKTGPGTNPKQEKIDSLIGQANIYLEQGLTDSAFAAFGLALEENPRLVVAHLGIGDIYKDRGNYQLASVRYELSAAYEPNNFDAHYNLGICKQVLGDLPYAIKSYLRAIAIDPDSSEANRDLASAYLQDNKAGLATAYAERAVELDAESYAAWANLGFIYIRTGRFEEAVDAFRTASEMAGPDDDVAPVLLGLADAHIRVGNYVRAQNVLNSLIRNSPSSTAYERMGVSFFKLRRYEDALDNFQEALKLDPADTAALNGQGVAYMTLYIEGGRDNTWQRDQAIQSWRESLEIDPNQEAIKGLLARYSNI
ncbi:MAG: tetratricopeptide repeat protein [Planctomycetota bacterium]